MKAQDEEKIEMARNNVELLRKELELFLTWQDDKNLLDFYVVEQTHPYMLELIPKRSRRTSSTVNGDIDLCFVGLLHGNEIIGSRILNQLLEALSQKPVDLRLGFILGNVDAALKGQRYLEFDLNRSFGHSRTDTIEFKRSDEIETFFNRTRFLVDYHQTREPSTEPFFIFPYTKSSFSFAENVGAGIPIVTHWSGSFSKLGQCSDEYVNNQGGVGVTLELGQNGMDDDRCHTGFQAGKKALSFVEAILEKNSDGWKSNVENGFNSDKTQADIYTWLHKIEYPESGEAVLHERWMNFSPVKKHTKIYTVDGVEYSVPEDSRILFPYYPHPSDVRPQAELCRLMKKIERSDLPSS